MIESGLWFMNICYSNATIFEPRITAWTGTWVPRRNVIDVPEACEGPNGVGILWEVDFPSTGFQAKVPK